MSDSNEQKTAAGAPLATAASAIVSIGQTYIVQCDGYRCIAFKDARGRWRRYFGNEELGEPVTVIKQFA